MGAENNGDGPLVLAKDTRSFSFFLSFLSQLHLEVHIPMTSVRELVPLCLLPGIKADIIVKPIFPGQRSDFTIPITMISNEVYLESCECFDSQTIRSLA